MRGRLVVASVIATLAGIGACLVDVDASRLDVKDAGDTDTASTGAPGLPCGAGRCLPPREVCCTGGFGNPNRAQGTCGVASDCPSGDYWECMAPSDCSKDLPICCAKMASSTELMKATCVANTCDGIVLCGDGGTCPTGRCLAGTTFVGLSECR